MRYLDGGAAHSIIAAGADVIDGRESDEFAAGHVPTARHVSLGSLPGQHLNGVPDKPVVVYCGHGERASTAASILERAGRGHVMNVNGGYPTLQSGRARSEL